MKQSDLEIEMSSLGAARHRSKVAKMRLAKLETCTPAGLRILEKAIGQHSKMVSSWLAGSAGTAGRMHSAHPLISGLKPEVIATVTCRIILDGISGHRTINALSMAVGRAIEDEVKFLDIRRRHRRWFSRIAKLARRHPVANARAKFMKQSARLAEIMLPSWRPASRGTVGLLLIELFRQATGLIEIETRKGMMGKDYTIVRAADGFLEWMDKSHASVDLISPVYMPMIVRPRDWDSPWLGGYLQLGPSSRPLIKTPSRRHLQTIEHMRPTQVYSAVNAVQSTPFVVDGEMLAVLRHCWENDLAIGDLPNRTEIPFPEFPEIAKTDLEARRTWRRAAGRIKFENECNRSGRISVSRTLQLASKFLGRTIWFPHDMDFRGRLYPKPIYLNVQGTEWTRSLLRFAHERPVDDDGMSWLAIHGANCLGHDKESYEQRLKVIQDNHGMIMSIGQDPLGCMEWTKADKPFLFLAFCKEWSKVNLTGRSSALPVHLDGSNNGLQIFSLLLKDLESARATNCVPCPSPRDIYADVAADLRARLASHPSPHARTWLQFGIDRKTTKRVVMCMPYGLTKFSANEYLRDWHLQKCRAMGDHRPFAEDQVFDAIRLLSDLLWQSIHEICGAASRCMDWLKKVARCHIEAGHPIRWTSPAGLLVEQSYKKGSRTVVKTSVGEVTRQHRIMFDSDDLSMIRNCNAISPNFVHSMDASVLMASVNMASAMGIDSFSCIHDSIGVRPSDAARMSSIIREVSVGIFLTPLLDDVLSEMKAYTGLDLPAPPAPGTLDVSVLRDADYYFS